jgi:signal peptidase
MKTLFKSINVFISIILVFAAIGVAMLAFPIFGNKAFIVRSGSMQPSIDIGSVVIVRPIASYKSGDVIAFRSAKNSKTTITHRVSSVESGPSGLYYKTKGDANNTIDGWEVKPSQIIGKMFVVVPYVGKLLIFARTSVGMPILIITPALFVIVLEFLNIVKEVKKKRKKKDPEHPLIIHRLSLEDLAKKPEKNFGFLRLMLPLLLGALFVHTTFAYFSDTESSFNNLFQAAATFPTPTVTPTITPTPTPCSGQGCCGNNTNNVVVTGGGTGSNTSAVVVNNCSSTVVQNNNTTTNTNVHTTTNTGGNTQNGNTGGTNTTTSGSSNTVTVTTSGSSNTTH